MSIQHWARKSQVNRSIFVVGSTIVVRSQFDLFFVILLLLVSCVSWSTKDIDKTRWMPIFWAIFRHIWWEPYTVHQLAAINTVGWIKIIDKIDGINSLNIFAFSFKFRFAFPWCFYFLLNISASFCLLMNALRNWLFGILVDPGKQRKKKTINTKIRFDGIESRPR